MEQTVSASEAAVLLNVSEPFVHELIQKGELSAKDTRLVCSEVFAYRDARSKERETALAEMVALGEEHDLPY